MARVGTCDTLDVRRERAVGWAGPTRRAAVILLMSGFALVGMSAPADAATSTVSISVGDTVVCVNFIGDQLLHYPVTLSSASTAPVSVSYASKDGTAHSPGDFTAVSGTLSYAANETTKTITVVVHCGHGGSNLLFHVLLSNPVNAVLGNASAYGSIVYKDVCARGCPG